MTYRARILESPSNWYLNTIRLMLVNETINNGAEIVMADGTVKYFPDLSVLSDDMGIVIPKSAVNAILEAFAEWQGRSSDSKTEVAVLREWLAVEKDRVDHLIDRALTP